MSLFLVKEYLENVFVNERGLRMRLLVFMGDLHMKLGDGGWRHSSILYLQVDGIFSQPVGTTVEFTVVY